MGRIIEHKLRGAREVTLAEVDGRSYPAKLRDSIARLFSLICRTNCGSDEQDLVRFRENFLEYG